MAATYLGIWFLLLVVGYYGPWLISALMDASTGAKLESLNYFADTLLFGATILTLAKASSKTSYLAGVINTFTQK